MTYSGNIRYRRKVATSAKEPFDLDENWKFVDLRGFGVLTWKSGEKFGGEAVSGLMDGLGMLSGQGDVGSKGRICSLIEINHKDFKLASVKVTVDDSNIQFWDGSTYQGGATYELETGMEKPALPSEDKGLGKFLRIEGEGVFRNKEGEVFAGKWDHEGRFWGRYRMRDGRTVFGSLTREGLKLNNVVIKIDEGLIYRGGALYRQRLQGEAPSDNDLNESWKFKSLEGQALVTHPKKGVFRGEFKDGHPWGEGRYRRWLHKNKDEYSFAFGRDGMPLKREGKGEVRLPGIGTYKGDIAWKIINPLKVSSNPVDFWELEPAIPHGKGTVKLTSGEEIPVEFCFGLAVSEVKELPLPSRSKFSGGNLMKVLPKEKETSSKLSLNLRFEHKHGKGQEALPDGTRLDGLWRLSKRVGLFDVKKPGSDLEWKAQFDEDELTQLTVGNHLFVEYQDINTGSSALDGRVRFNNNVIVVKKTFFDSSYYFVGLPDKQKFVHNGMSSLAGFFDDILRRVWAAPFASDWGAGFDIPEAVQNMLQSPPPINVQSMNQISDMKLPLAGRSCGEGDHSPAQDTKSGSIERSQEPISPFPQANRASVKQPARSKTPAGQNVNRTNSISGKNDGKNTKVLPSGATYTGDVKGDKMHGKGTLKLADGTVFAGDFAMGEIRGKGRLETADGQVIEGWFAKGANERDSYSARSVDGSTRLAQIKF